MHSPRQHSTTWLSDHRAFPQTTQHHMVVRLSFIPPDNTVQHGGQIIVHSTSQHSTTWWSDHRAFHQSTHGGQIIVHSTSPHSTTWRSDHRTFHQTTQYHTVVRPSCIPPVHTVPHGGQIIVHSTSPHSTTWWSDHCAFHQSTQYDMVLRSKACEERNWTWNSARNPLCLRIRSTERKQVACRPSSTSPLDW